MSGKFDKWSNLIYKVRAENVIFERMWWLRRLKRKRQKKVVAILRKSSIIKYAVER